MRPNKPIDTFEGFKKGDFALAEASCDIEFYPNVPKIGEMPKYKGLKPLTKYKGGETQGLESMNKYMSDKQKVAAFRKPMTVPTSLKPDTTVMSPYLKFGSVSSRTFFWAIQDIYDAKKGNYTKPPESLQGQLFFREFFYSSRILGCW